MLPFSGTKIFFFFWTITILCKKSLPKDAKNLILTFETPYLAALGYTSKAFS